MRYSIYSLKNTPKYPQLKAGYVDVYIQRLSDITKALGDPVNYVSLDDQLRANRLHQAIHRKQSLATRAATRFVLALYTKQDASSLSIQRTHSGKPYLVGYPEIHFSVSHSNTTFTIAVASNRVGIDVEEYDATVDISAVSQKYFSPQEQYYMKKQNNPFDAFYTIWTAKEALIKCHDINVENANTLKSPNLSLKANFKQQHITSFLVSPNCYCALTHYR